MLVLIKRLLSYDSNNFILLLNLYLNDNYPLIRMSTLEFFHYSMISMPNSFNDDHVFSYLVTNSPASVCSEVDE